MKTRISTFTAYLFGTFMLSGLSFKSFAQSFSESFDDITTLAGSGWIIQNNSSPIGSLSWFQGTATTATPTPGPFNSYNGAANAYIAVNFNSTGSTGTISNWLITPNRTLRNGDVFTFYTRKPTISSGQTDYPDRLEVRMSTNGASTNAGANAAQTGDFSTLLLSVNPTLVANVYPQVWTQYTITISGLPAPTSGRIAFRYFVTGAGSLGTNSDYIGIDQVDYTPYVCPAFTMTAGGALTGGTAGASYTQTLSQTGALGAPSFAITSGALPPGLTLASNGTISGTPTATGTFNFTATVSDASGCSGAQNYSITVVCPANPISFSASPSICDNADPYVLTEGTPAGGTYSGTGVTGGTFDPMAGTQTIVYDYTDPYGCAFNSDYTITVNTSPTVVLDPLSAVCEDAGMVAMTGGSPAGGTYSGTGVTGSDFDPAMGTQTITYTYTDANGCVNDSSQTIVVNTVPTVTYDPVPAVCSNAGALTLTGGSPAGGTYSGTGVTGTDFDPTVGTQTITYTYTDANGCVNDTAQDITVNTAPTVTFTSPVSLMCIDDPSLTLSGGSPAGGTYSGTGVSGGIFSPTTTGAHVITYAYTDANGCDGEAMFTIDVDACLGIADNGQAFGFEMYPNPTTGRFTASVTSGTECSIVSIIDIHGKIIPFEATHTSANTIEVNLSNQAAGMYLVNGMIDNQPFTFRIQKQ